MATNLSRICLKSNQYYPKFENGLCISLFTSKYYTNTWICVLVQIFQPSILSGISETVIKAYRHPAAYLAPTINIEFSAIFSRIVCFRAVNRFRTSPNISHHNSSPESKSETLILGTRRSSWRWRVFNCPFLGINYPLILGWWFQTISQVIDTPVLAIFRVSAAWLALIEIMNFVCCSITVTFHFRHHFITRSQSTFWVMCVIWFW